MRIHYQKRKRNYKYRFIGADAVNREVELPIKVYDKDYTNGYLTLRSDGMLTIHHGYAWDGASGPTWDDKTNMAGSLVHDAMYQLIRRGAIGMQYRQYADHLLKSICVSDGMHPKRADLWLWAVRKFGFNSARLSKKEQKIYTAGR